MEHDETDKKAEIKRGAKENLYDKIPLTVKQLDVIIGVMIALFIAFFAVGVLKGNKIL